MKSSIRSDLDHLQPMCVLQVLFELWRQFMYMIRENCLSVFSGTYTSVYLYRETVHDDRFDDVTFTWLELCVCLLF